MRKHLLFVVAHRPDRSPGQRFRFEQYLSYLESKGFTYEFSPLLPSPADDRDFYAPGNYPAKARILLHSLLTRWQNWRNLDRYDAVFMYREALMIGSTFFEKAFARAGARLLVDFDDAIWLPAVPESNPRLAWLKRPDKINEIMRLCDMVLVGNEYLADHARQYNACVKVVPTTVDTDRFSPLPRPERPFVEIGWSGSHSTVAHFRTVIPVLERIKQRYGDRVRFKLIGEPNFRHEALQLSGIAWSSATEVAELNTLDIGLMPLPDDLWAQGKCGLKGLTYMALEIATVMSPVGVNRQIIRHGENGLLAANEQAWFEALCSLIENPDQRKQLGQAARRTVVAQYSVVAQRDRYVQFLDELLAMPKQR
jgi:glycosyltransferase involved in cell wall biosynthesis